MGVRCIQRQISPVEAAQGIYFVRLSQRYLYIDSIFFFFSSRRRHTRFDCDWSSDVCSSDLRVIEFWISAFFPKSFEYALCLSPNIEALVFAVEFKQQVLALLRSCLRCLE